jgi:cytochrome c peroxidase
MKARPLFLAILCAAPAVPNSLAEKGVLDLTALANYANQPKPAYITRNNAPPNNPVTDAGATLGRVLFYDERLSRDNTVSCSSCHQQAHGFSDEARVSKGVAGVTTRHAPRLINVRFANEVHFFWDERAPTLETLATQPIQSALEMGFSGTNGDPSFADLIVTLSAIPEYRILFTLAFGSPSIDGTRLQRALAQFMRSIHSFDSKYDVGRATTPDNQPFPNFDGNENLGKQLFTGFCAVCHRFPEFDINPGSLNNGVTSPEGGPGDFNVTRSPTLRDMVGLDGKPHGPFMHNGALPGLPAVLDHYNFIPEGTPNLDPRLANRNLNLSTLQRQALIAFMNTLTGNAVYRDEKWSNPFNANEQLSVVVMSPTGVRLTTNGDSTATLNCQVAAGLQYQLQSSTDLKNWTTTGTLTPDASGNISATVSVASGTYYRFAFTPP